MSSRQSIVAGLSNAVRYYQKETLCLVILLTTIALSLDYLCAPGSTNAKTILSSAFLLALLIRKASKNHIAIQSTPALQSWRIGVFALFHLTIAAVWAVSRGNTTGIQAGLLPVPLAAAKYLSLLPTAILLSWADWNRLQRLHRAELIAAVVALATLPSRIWAISWPWYSSILAHTIFALAAPFVSGLRYLPGAFPILSGPTLDTTITLACGGMLIVELFQVLFAIVVIVDWNKLNHRRTLVQYLGGICFLLLANILRITLLVVAGNRLSADLVVSQHLPVSWLVIAIALITYVTAAYPRMLNRQQVKEDVVEGRSIVVLP